MTELLTKLAEMPFVAQIIGIVVGFNLVVLGVMKVLEVFMDKTKTETDNKFHAVLRKLAYYMGLLIAYKK